MRRTYVLVLVLLAAAVIAAAPAGAHPPAPPAAAAPSPSPLAGPAAPLDEALYDAAPPVTMPRGVLVALAALSLLLAGRPRRAVALGLVGVVAMLAFETGVHATHHLGQPEQAARCVVAGASSNLSADVVDPVHDLPPAAAAEARVVLLAPSPVVARAVAPSAGRAPPALPA
jgi:hypothetical protein